MTFRETLIVMWGLHHGVAQWIISSGIADGIIQHLLEDRGIYGSKEKTQVYQAKEGILVNHSPQGLDTETSGSACTIRPEVHRERILRRHARSVHQSALSRMFVNTFTKNL